MLKRIASTGVNLVVIAVSVGVFLVAFIALNALGAAQRPPTIAVLSATRKLNIGDVIAANDLAVKTVFQDENASVGGRTTKGPCYVQLDRQDACPVFIVK